MVHQLAFQATWATDRTTSSIDPGILVALILAAVAAALIIRFVKVVLCVLGWLLATVMIVGIVEVTPVVSQFLNALSAVA
jgi:hypothetical protein